MPPASICHSSCSVLPSYPLPLPPLPCLILPLPPILLVSTSDPLSFIVVRLLRQVAIWIVLKLSKCKLQQLVWCLAEARRAELCNNHLCFRCWQSVVHPLVKGTPGIPGGRLNGSIDLGRGFIGRQCELMDVVRCPCVFVCMIACVCGLLRALGCVQPPPTH